MFVNPGSDVLNKYFVSFFQKIIIGYVREIDRPRAGGQ
jgi:hypothetical protein